MNTTDSITASPLPLPSWLNLFKVWCRIGFLSFGGPAAQIALMHKEIVQDRQWITEKQYLNALSFCMLLPGPEAMQLATYIGWRLRGVAGGLLAGLLFVLPGAFIILLLAAAYSAFGDLPVFSAFFIGITATIVVIVIQALARIASKALVSPSYYVIAMLAFVGIFFLALPFPIIIALAAIWGAIWGGVNRQHNDISESPPADQHSLMDTIKTVLIWLGIWWLPLLLLVLLLPGSVFADMGLFFSKLAIVTFGGAYAVLSYMAQDVVTQYQWLTATEMMDGLGLAETIPGPLILVTEFVGFVAAEKENGFWSGVAGAAITLWATFVPCFLWIFSFAPYIEKITHQPHLKGALSAITAAVVGVMCNLSIWFALHVIFQTVILKHYGIVSVWSPELSTVNLYTIALIALNAVLLFKYLLGILPLLAISACVGAWIM